MALTPRQLHQVVWVRIPAVLFFVVSALGRLLDGAIWDGLAFGLMGVAIAAAPSGTEGSRLSGVAAWSCVGVGMLGMVAWFLGPTDVVRVAGFLVAIGTQIALAVMFRRSLRRSQPQF